MSKIKPKEIDVGDVLVKDNWLMRRVIRITRNGDCAYQSYELDGTLFPYGEGVCSPEHLAKWANRKATSDEIASLAISERTPSEQSLMAALQKGICQYMDNLGMERLIVEAMKRGQFQEDDLPEFEEGKTYLVYSPAGTDLVLPTITVQPYASPDAVLIESASAFYQIRLALTKLHQVHEAKEILDQSEVTLLSVLRAVVKEGRVSI